MENQPNTFGSLFENAGNYLETSVELLKLQVVNKSSQITASVVSGITILLIIIFGIFILNIGVAIWVGDLLGKMYLGFFVVAGFYILLALLLLLFRKPWLKGPVSTMIIKKMLN
jgi:Putative Actinobacterial Holin-X, holin superfamily III